MNNGYAFSIVYYYSHSYFRWCIIASRLRRCTTIEYVIRLSLIVIISRFDFLFFYQSRTTIECEHLFTLLTLLHTFVHFNSYVY